ncbi:MAG: glycosyltransferase [Candidatus Omnitrophica bacterium]|nr:glycosyltransferase [Candidatus Omnitrophota bacterium]
MKISIVTPSFNQGAFIEEAVKSILAQNYPDFEHIIVDNCSSDKTAEILKKYPHLKVICEPDKGQSDALNKGFKVATGDVIGWLNADDFYLPGCFESVRGFLENHCECDVLYGDYRWINTEGRILQNRREIEFDLFILKYLHVLYIPSTATFFRRRIFTEGNFLDLRYRYAMDYDFFLRLALKDYSFGHLNKILASFRWHAGNKSLEVTRALAEQKGSLLANDPFLRSVPLFLKNALRLLLMCVARCKRYWKKLIKGFYWSQWERQ